MTNLRTTVAFFVAGTPVPQGSMKGFVVNGKALLTSANANLKPWREAVKYEAMQHRTTKLETPLSVELTFYMPRPKSYPKKVVHPWRKPDLDKLVRGVFDALTEANVWQDDALVVQLTASKRFPDQDKAIGVYIRVKEL